MELAEDGQTGYGCQAEARGASRRLVIAGSGGFAVTKIELREAFIGSGLTGEVHLESTLSWRDRTALEPAAGATRAAAPARNALLGS